MTEAEQLKVINENEKLGGNPTYSTYEEAEKALGESGIALILTNQGR
jgi:hypothetical protein